MKIYNTAKNINEIQKHSDINKIPPSTPLGKFIKTRAKSLNGI